MPVASLTRAYACVSIKALDEAERVIEGVASTPTPDRGADIVEPLGARYTLPLPLLWQHQHDQPVGHVVAARVGRDGVRFTAKFVKIKEPGPLRDRLDTAWQSVASGLVRGASIGFIPVDRERLPSGGTRFKTWDWVELSAVVVPMNAEASITSIKAFDAEALADLERRAPIARRAPPLSALAALEAKRAAVATQIGIARRSGDDWGYLMHLDEGLAAEIAAEKLRATNRALGIDPDFGLTPAPDVRRALESRLDALEADAARRINEAIASMDRRFDKALETYGVALGKAVRAVLDKEIPKDVLRYCGVYSRPLDYRKGAMVTDHGAAWIALRDVEPGERPGACDGWQLAVKSGRDGKDADQLQREKGR